MAKEKDQTQIQEFSAMQPTADGEANRAKRKRRKGGPQPKARAPRVDTTSAIQKVHHPKSKATTKRQKRAAKLARIKELENAIPAERVEGREGISVGELGRLFNKPRSLWDVVVRLGLLRLFRNEHGALVIATEDVDRLLAASALGTNLAEMRERQNASQGKR